MQRNCRAFWRMLLCRSCITGLQKALATNRIAHCTRSTRKDPAFAKASAGKPATPKASAGKPAEAKTWAGRSTKDKTWAGLSAEALAKAERGYDGRFNDSSGTLHKLPLVRIGML